MITFRPMREDEYPAYLHYFVADYAQEMAANFRLSIEDSLARAKQEIADYLPEGVNTPGHILLCAIAKEDNSDRHVGYLWYKPDSAMKTVFIYDFHILNAYQGQGMGKLTLQAFEHAMRDEGFKQVSLRVAGDNQRARHVYEAVGFNVTGFNMSKSLGE
ncbi:GNAT family N-acetyltransferase [Enterobacter sp. Bisph1]|uniref:GNAT family N-acetyltransferase n=1 Tax=Enterobacter sp. Bisph1 TaxID=1274399 RepID=UPI00057BD804|nr:GNAT family N-acetyltransferase [Enterobacter sp. Bisph1]